MTNFVMKKKKTKITEYYRKIPVTEFDSVVKISSSNKHRLDKVEAAYGIRCHLKTTSIQNSMKSLSNENNLDTTL